MPRKLYESDADLKREKSTIAFVKDKMGLGEVVKLPFKYKIDYAELNRMEDGGRSIINLIEIKTRNVSKRAYDTYMISADKFMTAKEYAHSFNVGFKLIVRWRDVIGCYSLKQGDVFSLGFNGRFDRGDWQDVEPVVYIPIKEFKDVI